MLTLAVGVFFCCYEFTKVLLLDSVASNDMQVQGSIGKVRVLSLIRDRKSERLIMNYLPAFELVSLPQQNIEAASITGKNFDLVVLDLDTFINCFDQIAIWRQSEAPLLLPLVVLVPIGETNRLSAALQGQIDALLYEPISSADLNIAAKTLLRMRHLSIEMLQQRRELERLSELKSKFTSTVAHEFRNPLSVIFSLSQLLMKNGEKISAEKRNSMIERIQAAVRKLTKLTDGLLVFNQNAAITGFSPKKVDLEDRCRGILDDFKLINEGMYEISFDVKGDCSNIFVDPALISTILTNLLANALKYSPDDSPVSLVLERQAEQVVVEVRDDGQGIPKEDQDSLFDAFFRARNVGDIEGSGLGLSIVKQCVELHSGAIEFQSEVGRGTTFTVFLPIDSV